MLERADGQQGWNNFLLCLKWDRPNKHICDHFQIHNDHVNHYKDMFQGVAVLEKHSNLTADQLANAVGFKYQVVSRWIDTDAILKARKDYDNGLVEVYTGPALCRGNIVRVLYSRKRAQPVIREPYFSAVVPA